MTMKPVSSPKSTPITTIPPEGWPSVLELPTGKCFRRVSPPAAPSMSTSFPEWPDWRPKLRSGDMPRNALATLLLVGLAACSDDAVDQPVQPQIDVLPSATAISVNTGASGTVTIAVKRDGGFTGDVTLSIETIPTGVSARFDPAT